MDGFIVNYPGHSDFSRAFSTVRKSKCEDSPFQRTVGALIRVKVEGPSVHNGGLRALGGGGGKGCNL